ncbi:MAG: Rab family GTPase [Promethearchaeota archaeon]
MPIENYVRKNYFKIILAGDGAVGKTTLSKRLTGTLKRDERIQMTPGVDFHSLKIKKNVINLQIWDLGGQEQFRYFQNDFFGGATIVVLIYGIDSYNTFKGLSTWLDFVPKEMYKYVFLIGNKIDMEDRSVNMEEALKFAEDHGFGGYYETSALNGVGIDEFELDLVKTIEEIFIDRKK